jgi:uncharacterized protein with von Willebrand factor type A (vWA) domain
VFLDFLFHLRAQGLAIGVGEWLGFLRALERGLVTSGDDLYRLGRALLCRSEVEFDRYDLAFAAAFRGASLPEDLKKQIEQWLAAAADVQPTGAPLDEQRSPDELWKELLERLKQQKERHDGGNHWVGTRGTSPYGNNGEGKGGLRIGGQGGRGGAVQVAMERKWAAYRTDRVIEVRDFEVALRTLRKLRREGELELDLDGTIDRTCKNAGEIELVERPSRKNQVHLVLLMDAGGSMAPHVEKVERLFTAATRTRAFKSFKHYSFHNCVYDRVYTDIERGEAVPTLKFLSDLGPRHRLVFVGDASMAPYELFQPFGFPGAATVAGLEWLRRLKERAPGSIWLNPDPTRFWAHPTVNAIGRLFPMFELTVGGLREAVRKLRAPV